MTASPDLRGGRPAEPNGLREFRAHLDERVCEDDPATMGVDLIYYQQPHDSFVLVQYKRLQRERHRLVFRPSRDRTWGEEPQRMRRVRIGAASKTVARLSPQRGAVLSEAL